MENILTKSNVRINSEFKVGSSDYSAKNRNVHLKPGQLKSLLVSEREYLFITKNQLKYRQMLYNKDYFEKIQLKSLKKDCVFENKLLFTNKLN